MDAATLEGDRDVCEPRLPDLDAAITRPGSNRHRHPVALRCGGQGEPVGKKVPILGDDHQKRSGGGSHGSLAGEYVYFVPFGSTSFGRLGTRRPIAPPAPPPSA